MPTRCCSRRWSRAHAAARFYDTKAQIVGVGYILALNVVLHFGDLLPNHAPIGPLFFAAVWLIVIMPIVQFGQVLYPSRTAGRSRDGGENGRRCLSPARLSRRSRPFRQRRRTRRASPQVRLDVGRRCRASQDLSRQEHQAGALPSRPDDDRRFRSSHSGASSSFEALPSSDEKRAPTTPSPGACAVAHVLRPRPRTRNDREGILTVDTMAKTAEISDRHRGDESGFDKAPRAVAGSAFGSTYAHPASVTGQPSRTTRPHRDASATLRTRLDGHPRPRPPKHNLPKRGADVPLPDRSGPRISHRLISVPLATCPALLAWWLVAVTASSELPRIGERVWPKQESATLPSSHPVRWVKAAGW